MPLHRLRESRPRTNLQPRSVTVKVLETGRMVLRRMDVSDVDGLMEIFSDLEAPAALFSPLPICSNNCNRESST